MKKINTLEKFAELINSADEWKIEFTTIIEENGWQDETDTEYGICHSGHLELVFDENGKAIVKKANER